MKIDLEKTFDKLEWSFIRHTLIYVNFLAKIINIIMNCICSSSTTFLVNGTRTNFFNLSRGICKGDPISPYIFILCMEVLYHNITEDVSSKEWDPILVSLRSPLLSHIFFADDLVLISSTKSDSCRKIKSTLENFCTWSGQNINHPK